MRTINTTTIYIKGHTHHRKKQEQVMPSNGFCITYNLLINKTNPTELPTAENINISLLHKFLA